MAEEIKKSTVTGIAAHAERRDEYSDASVERKWPAFKAAFGCGLSKIFLVSALCMIFCAPGIAWVIVYTTLFIAKIGVSLPYGIHDGLGYLSPTALPAGLNSAFILGNIKYFEFSMTEFAVLVPCIACAAVGIGGLVYVARMAMNREPVKVLRHFFLGVKYTWLSALAAGLLVGASLLLVMFCFYAFDAAAYGAPVNLGGKIVTMIFSILLLVLVSIYAFYLVTLSASYKMPFGDVLLGALRLTFVRMPLNLLCALFAGIIVGAAFALILLLGNSTFGVLFWFLLFFVGFYAVTAIFTVFDAKVFETSVNEELRDRETRMATEEAYAAIRARKAAEKAEKAAQKAAADENTRAKKQEQTKFVNPKKKKKTDASPQKAAAQQPKPQPKPAVKGYSAEELAQLEADKQKIRAEAAENKPDAEAVDLSLYEDDGE